MATVHFFAPMGSGTGNLTTTNRIAELLRPHFANVICHNANAVTYPTSIGSSENCAGQLAVGFETALGHQDVLVCLHAFRAAPWMCSPLVRQCPKRILIFGGTDVNELPLLSRSPESDAMKVMAECVAAATTIVCFSEALRMRATELWSSAQMKMVVIPQSVVLPTGLSYYNASIGRSKRRPSGNSELLLDGEIQQAISSLTTRCSTCTPGNDDPSKWIVLIPCGLRDVKDPLFVLDAFLSMNERLPAAIVLRRLCTVYLVGPKLDAQYGSLVEGRLRTLEDNSVRWCPSLPHDELLRCMLSKRVCCVVNTSKSEGQPQAIMEAMALGCPAVARNISGNAAVVADGQTGMLFNTAEEFLQCVAVVVVSKIAEGRISDQADDGDEDRTVVSTLRELEKYVPPDALLPGNPQHTSAPSQSLTDEAEGEEGNNLHAEIDGKDRLFAMAKGVRQFVDGIRQKAVEQMRTVYSPAEELRQYLQILSPGSKA